MDEYDEVYTYLESGTYPEGLSKDGKRNWRRKCKENFQNREWAAVSQER